MFRKSLTVLDITKMKDKLLIVGAGGFGRVTLEHAIKDFDCSFVDDGKPIGEEINGIKVVGGVNELPSLFTEYKNIVLSIGNNKIREKVYKLAKEIGYSFPCIVDKSAYISPYASVGDGCVILNNVVIQNGSKVGNASILNPGVEVHHDSSVGNFCCIYTNSVIRTYAKVEDSVKIGSNVTIKNESVVYNDIDDGETI